MKVNYCSNGFSLSSFNKYAYGLVQQSYKLGQISADEDIYEGIKNVIYTDSIVVSEAAGINRAYSWLEEVVIRQMKCSLMHTRYTMKRLLALEIALTIYEREEEAYHESFIPRDPP
ncbi:unnamed protein product [Vicia faba]|uniref:Uncharacterized protein n=1 Tax=Vicia faba TaxID=3906 RepID=A0AAV1B8K1_VICFA|nr:unnamed protein product [Vicia faba]